MDDETYIKSYMARDSQLKQMDLMHNRGSDRDTSNSRKLL